MYSCDSGNGVVQTVVLGAMGFCDLCKHWMKVISVAHAEKIASVSVDSSLLAVLSFGFAQGLKALEEVKVNKQLLPHPNQNKLRVCHICKKPFRVLLHKNKSECAFVQSG